MLAVRGYVLYTSPLVAQLGTIASGCAHSRVSLGISESNTASAFETCPLYTGVMIIFIAIKCYYKYYHNGL